MTSIYLSTAPRTKGKGVKDSSVSLWTICCLLDLRRCCP